MAKDPQQPIELPYSNERAYDGFKRVRNRMRKFSVRDVAFTCMAILNGPQTEQRLSCYPPHNLLLLMKWAFRYGEYHPWPRRRLTTGRFNGLVNLVSEFESCVRMPSDYPSLGMWAKTMGHQQFYLQHGVDRRSWVRPLLLFLEGPKPERIWKRFGELTGLDLDVFLDLGCILVGTVAVRDKPTRFDGSYFASVEGIPPNAIESFLQALSIPFEHVKQFLEESEGLPRSWDYEFRRETPFARRPLLAEGRWYYPFCHNLLCHSVEYFVYNLLREDSPQDFGDAFGDVFESYVGRALEAAGICFTGEGELRRALPGGSKVVDFLIPCGGASVLVDAKGVELHHLGRVTHQGDVLDHKLRTSVSSAILQANDTVRGLRLSGPGTEVQLEGGPVYLVVVTYKPLYIGNGEDFVRIIGEDRAASLRQKLGGDSSIPWRHMYFLSLDEFDVLVGCLQHGQSLAEIMAEAVATDSNGATKVLAFRQHLRSRMPKELPNHIEHGWCMLDTCMRRRLKEGLRLQEHSSEAETS